MGRVKGAIVKDRTVTAEALREALKPIHEKMQEKGVKNDDLPSNEYLIEKIVKMVDSNLVEKLAEDYSDWINKKP